MRVQILIRGENNAQNVFDFYNGSGVRWFAPTDKRQRHSIFVNVPDSGSPELVQSMLRATFHPRFNNVGLKVTRMD